MLPAAQHRTLLFKKIIERFPFMKIQSASNSLIIICLLALLSLKSHGDVALRVVCSTADSGAVVYVNEKERGVCPDDFFVTAGSIHLRVVKHVDNDYERVFEQTLFKQDGDVKKIIVTLSEPRLSLEAIKRIEIEKLKQEKLRFDSAILDARNGDIEAMKFLSEIYNKGDKSIIKDSEKSNYWRLKATETTMLENAKQGNLESIDNLIELFYGTEGYYADSVKENYWRTKKSEAVEKQNVERAQRLLEEAANGNKLSMNAIAELYKTGKGVEINPEMSEYWFNRYQQMVVLDDMKAELYGVQYFENWSDLFSHSDTTLYVVSSPSTIPTAVVAALTDLFFLPSQATQKSILQNNIDTHAAKWGLPNSMISKSSR